MAHGNQEPDEIISGINVTPLVDIVLVILIIFIVTASFVFRNTIDMDLPRARSAEQTVSGLLNLAITADGRLYLDGRPAELDDIPRAVAEAGRRLAEQGKEPRPGAFVSADVATDYGTFAAVVDRLRLEGVSRIALDTRPAERAEGE